MPRRRQAELKASGPVYKNPGTGVGSKGIPKPQNKRDSLAVIIKRSAGLKALVQDLREIEGIA